MTETEADTCRKFVVPMLRKAGWDDTPHAVNEQRTFTGGRIVFVGGSARWNTKMPSLDARATALDVVDRCQTVRCKLTDIGKELSELLPAMLHKVFGGEAGCSTA